MSREQKFTGVTGVNHTPPAVACEVLTPSDLAEFLKIPASRVYELTRFRAGSRGEPIPHRKVGRELRFIKGEVERWLLGLPQPQHLQKRAYKKDAA